MVRPYTDLNRSTTEIIREFGEDIDPTELMWHRDDEDRLIEILECGEGWKFQFEDELPWDLEENFLLLITRHEWHRVIKGEGKLKIKIMLS